MSLPAPFVSSQLAPTGQLRLVRVRRVRRAPWTWRLRNWISYRWRELLPRAVVYALARWAGVGVLEGTLRLVLYRADGEVIDYGIVSRRVVTTAGVNFLTDAFQGTVEPEVLRYHGFGTGTAAESVGDTALQTELTTQYNPDNTRPTGTLTEGASANIFRTVATLTPDSGGTIAITEHGLFSQAATGGGTLWDRSVFSAINVVAGTDSLQATYDLTNTAGG